jgi:hypothetical protein
MVDEIIEGRNLNDRGPTNNVLIARALLAQHITQLLAELRSELWSALCALGNIN